MSKKKICKNCGSEFYDEDFINRDVEPKNGLCPDCCEPDLTNVTCEWCDERPAVMWIGSTPVCQECLDSRYGKND